MRGATTAATIRKRHFGRFFFVRRTCDDCAAFLRLLKNSARVGVRIAIVPPLTVGFSFLVILPKPRFSLLSSNRCTPDLVEGKLSYRHILFSCSVVLDNLGYCNTSKFKHQLCGFGRI